MQNYLENLQKRGEAEEEEKEEAKLDLDLLNQSNIEEEIKEEGVS